MTYREVLRNCRRKGMKDMTRGPRTISSLVRLE